jgi:hypothetical protein
MDFYKERSIIIEVIKSKSKELKFLQTSLVKANRAYRENIIVTPYYLERNFRMTHDCRRLIIFDKENSIQNSKPFNNINEATLARSIISAHKLKYQGLQNYTPVPNKLNTYSYDKLFFGLFVRGLNEGVFTDLDKNISGL